MKSYENKKIYNFKVKHKRKRRTRSAQIWWKAGSAYYLKKKRQEYRCRCKEILRKQVQGQDIEFLLYRKTLWWDS
jgi:hypothetical protein